MHSSIRRVVAVLDSLARVEVRRRAEQDELDSSATQKRRERRRKGRDGQAHVEQAGRQAREPQQLFPLVVRVAEPVETNQVS